MTVEGLGDDAGRSVRIEFQNENLAIWEGDEPTVTVPDLITLVASDTGEPITTELIRFGLRADVLVLPCPALLQTDQALAVVGPRAFGIDLDYATGGVGRAKETPGQGGNERILNDEVRHLVNGIVRTELYELYAGR